MTSRTLALIAVVLLLAGLTTYLLLADDSNDADALKTTKATADRIFKVEDIDRIGRVFIADRQGNTSDLRLDPATGKWTFQDKYDANPNSIKNLLDAVTRIEMDYQPNNKAVPKLVQDLATEGIKVEVYDRNNELINAYYIGGPTMDERGTYGIREGYDQPYVINIPGWTGNVRYRFNLTGDDWRQKKFTDRDISEITAFSLDYPKQRDKSFRAERRSDGRWLVQPFYESTAQTARTVAAGEAEGYLAPLEKLYINRYLNDRTELLEEDRELIPFAILNFKWKDGRNDELKFYPRLQNIFMQDRKSGKQEIVGNKDGYGAFINDGQDYVLFGETMIEPFFVSIDRF